MTHTTIGIIIWYQKYREYDRIYTVYTKDFGKLQLLARGSNKIRSKLAGHLEPCCLSSLMIVHTGGIEILAQARTVKAFWCIRCNPIKFHLALVLLESLDKLTHTHEPDIRVFQLLLQALKWLQDSEMVQTSLIYHYLLHLLVYLGYAPDVRHQKELQPLLVADIRSDDIIVDDKARVLIEGYLHRALDGREVYSLVNIKY